VNIADQIERAKREIASWPRWMQDAARQASANMEPSMDTTALSRYTNAGRPIGHTGPDAPIHADERIALADLPRLADSPQPAADGFRAELLQRDARRLEERLSAARKALEECVAELEKDPSAAALVYRARRALLP